MDFNVNVIAKVNLNQVKDLENRLKKLSATPIKIDLDMSDGKLRSIENAILQNAQKAGKTIGKGYADYYSKEISKSSDNYYNPYRDAYQSIGNKSSTLTNMQKFYEDQAKEAVEHQRNADKILHDYQTRSIKVQKNKIDNDLKSYSSISQADIDAFNSSFNDLSSAAKSYEIDKSIENMKRLESAQADYADSYKRISNEIKIAKQNGELGVDPKTLANFQKQVRLYRDANTKMHDRYGANVQSILDTSGVVGLTASEFKRLQTEFSNIQKNVIAEGIGGKSIWSEASRGFKKIFQFATTYGLIQSALYDVPHKIVTAVKDVNAAQIELRKVSDAPTAQLEQYFDDASTSAKKYGATISDVINSTADWSRLGYGLEESKELSDATTLLLKVGDNMTQESSAQGMISTLSGFEMQADEAMKIVDIANEVANTQPIDTAGIFDSLARSASSMSAANNTLEETIALTSAANSVVQDPSSIGTAFKTKIVFMYRNVHIKHI